MILVDKDIRTFLNNGNILVQENKSLDVLTADTQTAILYADPLNVTNIGYDITTKSILVSGEEKESCVLVPGASATVVSEEIFHFDKNTCGMLNLKNSRVRMGMYLTSPVYQPGHTTRLFFRITNMSDCEITLNRGEKYAMLMFNQLHDAPDAPYSGTFRDEIVYKGLSDYTSVYEKQMKAIEKKKEDLYDIEHRLYGNVVTILTIFIAVFSLLNLNISLAKEASEPYNFLLYNLSVLGSIGFLSALLDELLNRAKKHSHLLWLIPIVTFIGIGIIALVK